MTIDILVVVLSVAGMFFFIATTIGILRFPDFYSRMHAAGKGDALSSVLMVTGLALYNLHHLSLGNVFTSAKLLMIVLFIFLASPTATHAIVDAGFEAGIQPWSKFPKGPAPAPGKDDKA